MTIKMWYLRLKLLLRERGIHQNEFLRRDGNSTLWLCSKFLHILQIKYIFFEIFCNPDYLSARQKFIKYFVFLKREK